mgnify:CR=1 FL=1
MAIQKSNQLKHSKMAFFTKIINKNCNFFCKMFFGNNMWLTNPNRYNSVVNLSNYCTVCIAIGWAHCSGTGMFWTSEQMSLTLIRFSFNFRVQNFCLWWMFYFSKPLNIFFVWMPNLKISTWTLQTSLVKRSKGWAFRSYLNSRSLQI